MILFELGNPKYIEKLTLRDFVLGKFVFRRDDLRFRLFLGEFNSHPELVERLDLVKKTESQYKYIFGGGNFKVEKQEMKFSSFSGNYGRVPNSFIIDFCRNVKIPNIERFVFKLTPYSLEDPMLDERRKTWREIGGYELDTEMKEYAFDKDMNRL